MQTCMHARTPARTQLAHSVALKSLDMIGNGYRDIQRIPTVKAATNAIAHAFRGLTGRSGAQALQTEQL